jgi:hypothetical protein
MDVKSYAADLLGRPTDIMTRDSLHKILRPAIEASAVRVFWMAARSLALRLTDIIEAIERGRRGNGNG